MAIKLFSIKRQTDAKEQGDMDELCKKRGHLKRALKGVMAKIRGVLDKVLNRDQRIEEPIPVIEDKKIAMYDQQAMFCLEAGIDKEVLKLEAMELLELQAEVGRLLGEGSDLIGGSHERIEVTQKEDVKEEDALGLITMDILNIATLFDLAEKELRDMETDPMRSVALLFDLAEQERLSMESDPVRSISTLFNFYDKLRNMKPLEKVKRKSKKSNAKINRKTGTEASAKSGIKDTKQALQKELATEYWSGMSLDNLVDANASYYYCGQDEYEHLFDSTYLIFLGKRHYDRRQTGRGGQTKPAFHMKAKTTKKIVFCLECYQCKCKLQLALKCCNHFGLGDDKKSKGNVSF